MPAPKVLVVEDDHTILQLLEVNFEMEGFEVVKACDGREGLKAAIDASPDIVVTDVMMPHMSGLEMLAALRAEPATKDIPVIVLSARAQGTDVRHGLDAGADAYMTKPFEPLELIDRVNELLAR